MCLRNVLAYTYVVGYFSVSWRQFNSIIKFQKVFNELISACVCVVIFILFAKLQFKLWQNGIVKSDLCACIDMVYFLRHSISM